MRPRSDLPSREPGLGNMAYWQPPAAVLVDMGPASLTPLGLPLASDSTPWEPWTWALPAQCRNSPSANVSSGTLHHPGKPFSVKSLTPFIITYLLNYLVYKSISFTKKQKPNETGKGPCGQVPCVLVLPLYWILSPGTNCEWKNEIVLVWTLPWWSKQCSVKYLEKLPYGLYSNMILREDK